ncbi:hypothetical protein ACLBWH_18315 [Sphingomonas sp. M6A6_1c]
MVGDGKRISAHENQIEQSGPREPLMGARKTSHVALDARCDEAAIAHLVFAALMNEAASLAENFEQAVEQR